MRRAAAGPAVLAVLAVLALLVGGCGDSPEDVRAAYCDTVEDQQARLSEIMAEDSAATLLRALPVFRDLAEDAPRDVADDWQQVVDALTGLERALDAAGVEPGEYDVDDPPDDVARPEQQAIARAADELARPEVAAALEGVQQQAKDVCKTPLYR